MWRMKNTIKTKSKFEIKRSNPMAWELEKEIKPLGAKLITF